MITQIGACKNGEGGWWLYAVNKTAIPEGASARQVQPQDTIRFFFRTK